ncbi:MAG: sulfatase [Qingshengfaniella sp.]
MPKQPNFILFVTDQHRADHLGCYGHAVLRTPHIDALAAEGVAFDKFFVTSPVCMPNRASLMTGRMPSSHGVWTNGTPLSTDHVTFVDLLRRAGYDTALIGKSHLQNFAPAGPALRQPAAPEGVRATDPDTDFATRSGFDADGYDQELPAHWAGADPTVSLPFYGFDHVDLVTGHGDGAGGAYGRWLRSQRPDAGDLIGAANQAPHDYTVPQAVRTQVPEELYTTNWIADRAIDWIENRPDPDKPYFLMVSWPDPHHPFNPPGKYWDMYRPEDMAVPEAFTRPDWTPPFYVQDMIDARAAGSATTTSFGSFACSEREALEARALTCGMIAMIDDALGRICDTLHATGTWENTVKIFTADHGDHLGDHKLLLKGPEHYDQITRVPFIWSDPEGPSGTREAGLAQTHDIGPSILARARVQASFGMQGQPLPVAGGTARDAALIQFDMQRGNPRLGPIPRVHTVHDGRYRMSIFDGVPDGELYDTVTDPGEFLNLWHDPQAAPAKAAMMECFVRLEIAVADRLPEPRGLA